MPRIIVSLLVFALCAACSNPALIEDWWDAIDNECDPRNSTDFQLTCLFGLVEGAACTSNESTWCTSKCRDDWGDCAWTEECHDYWYEELVDVCLRYQENPDRIHDGDAHRVVACCDEVGIEVSI